MGQTRQTLQEPGCNSDWVRRRLWARACLRWALLLRPPSFMGVAPLATQLHLHLFLKKQAMKYNCLHLVLKKKTMSRPKIWQSRRFCKLRVYFLPECVSQQSLVDSPEECVAQRNMLFCGGLFVQLHRDSQAFVVYGPEWLLQCKHLRSAGAPIAGTF